MARVTSPSSIKFYVGYLTMCVKSKFVWLLFCDKQLAYEIIDFDI